MTASHSSLGEMFFDNLINIVYICVFRDGFCMVYMRKGKRGGRGGEQTREMNNKRRVRLF